MCRRTRNSITICALVGLIVVASGTAQANWVETFDGNAFDLATWQFHSYPQVLPTFTQTIVDGPDDNDYLSLDETASVGAKPPGSAFGVGMGNPNDVFTDVRMGAVVNVVGDASRNYHALAPRTTYIIDDGSISGAPGIMASGYVLLINWEDGPANLTIEVQKYVNLSNIMRIDYEVVVPGLDHARSYYAEVDIVGSGPVYITGSLYEYKGGPLVARVPTLIDTNGNDPWEDEGLHDEVFTSGVSGIAGFNEGPEPAGYHTTFDDVFSISDGPAAVNPSPADGATDVSIVADLSWVEAAFATARDLWFGKKGAVQKVDPAPAGTTFDPGTLEFGETYEWRIDEIGPASTVTGHTWTFRTGRCLVVDDFESYSDDTAIESKWPHNVPPTPFAPYHYVFLETGRVSQGGKSMRLEYQNQYEPFLTEATLTFDSPQDWTIAGVNTLSLFFSGEDDNVEQPMYVKLSDAAGNTSTVVHPYTYAVQSEFWRSWEIALEQFSNGGVNLAAITKIAIGIGDGTNSGQELEDRDSVYIDHIRLCPPPSETR